MDRPIPKYLDYMFGVDAEACLRAERRERDLTLLRAIRLQSFGATRSAYLHAESMPTSVLTFCPHTLSTTNPVRPNVCLSHVPQPQIAEVIHATPFDPLSRCAALSRHESQPLQRRSPLFRHRGLHRPAGRRLRPPCETSRNNGQTRASPVYSVIAKPVALPRSRSSAQISGQPHLSTVARSFPTRDHVRSTYLSKQTASAGARNSLATSTPFAGVNAGVDDHRLIKKCL